MTYRDYEAFEWRDYVNTAKYSPAGANIVDLSGHTDFIASQYRYSKQCK